jgi:hypothetical protein
LNLYSSLSNPVRLYPAIEILSVYFTVWVIVLSVLMFSCSIIWYSFSFQFAVYTLFPVSPASITKSFCGFIPLEPVQPMKVYPSLVGFAIAYSLTFYETYEVGLELSFIPPVK